VAIRKIWKLAIILVAFAAAGFIGVAYWVWSGMNALASLQPGMVALNLPSGVTAYLRRQAYSGKPAVIYISANPSFCAPYDRYRDYKLPLMIRGDPQSPVFISYTDDTIVVHSPEPPIDLSSTQPSSFSVTFEKLTPEAYTNYVGKGRNATELPKSWKRVEVPFQNNTCAP
jgi:hypothetical protein